MGIFKEQLDIEVQASLEAAGTHAVVPKGADYTITAAEAGATILVGGGSFRGTLAAGLADGFEVSVVTNTGATGILVEPPAGETITIPPGLGFATGEVGSDAQALQFDGALRIKKNGSTWLVIGIAATSVAFEGGQVTLGNWDEGGTVYIDSDPIGHLPGFGAVDMTLKDNGGFSVDFIANNFSLLFSQDQGGPIVLISDGVVQVDVAPGWYEDPDTGIRFSDFSLDGSGPFGHFQWDFTNATEGQSGDLVVNEGFLGGLDLVTNTVSVLVAPAPAFANDLAVNFAPGVADDVGAWYHTQDNVLGGVGGGASSVSSLAISLWIKSPNDGNSGTGLEPFWMGQWKDGGVNDWKLDVYDGGPTAENRLRFHVIDPATGFVTKYYIPLSSVVQPGDGLWHHLLLVYDHATTALPTLYVDGVFAGDWTDDGSSGGGATAVRVGTGSTGLSVGSMVDGSGGGAQVPLLVGSVPIKQYGGEFDEVALWFDTGQALAAAGPLGWLAGGVRDLNDIADAPQGISAPQHWWRFGDDVASATDIGNPVSSGDQLPNLGTAAGTETVLVPGDATPVQIYSAGPLVATS